MLLKELTSPAASEQSRLDCEAIVALGLKAKILTHVRCNMEDAKMAVATGVDGVDVVIVRQSYDCLLHALVHSANKLGYIEFSHGALTWQGHGIH